MPISKRKDNSQISMYGLTPLSSTLPLFLLVFLHFTKINHALASNFSLDIITLTKMPRFLNIDQISLKTGEPWKTKSKERVEKPGETGGIGKFECHLSKADFNLCYHSSSIICNHTHLGNQWSIPYLATFILNCGIWFWQWMMLVQCKPQLYKLHKIGGWRWFRNLQAAPGLRSIWVGLGGTGAFCPEMDRAHCDVHPNSKQGKSGNHSTHPKPPFHP